MKRRRVQVLAATVFVVAVAGVAIGLAARDGSRTGMRSDTVQSPAKKKTYGQLVTANYRVLTPARTTRLLRFADAAYGCMSKQLQLGRPRTQPTKIVMALAAGTTAHAVARIASTAQ